MNRDSELEKETEQDAEAQRQEQEAIKAQQEVEKKQAEEEKRLKDEELYSYKVKKEQISLLEKLMKLVGSTEEKKKEPTKNKDGLVTPVPTPAEEAKLAKQEQERKLKIIADAIKSGFLDYGAKSGYDNPLATMSAEMAQAGEENPLPDPYLPATMNLMETSGSKNMAQENNYFNWGSKAKPDINTAINGIYQGVANPDGLYKDYLQSGQLSDFFKTYTPSIDPNNPNQEELIKRYTSLRKYFPQ